MARIRSIKPEFFTNHKLYQAEVDSGLPLRLAFAGLWTQADRRGRFRWSPPELQLGCLPYDNIDFSRVLDALATRHYIERYVGDDGKHYGWIPSFEDHQSINNREQESRLPDPDECELFTYPEDGNDASSTREGRVRHAPLGEGKGREGKGREGKGSPADAGAAPPNPKEKSRSKKDGPGPLPTVDELEIPRTHNTPEFRTAFQRWIDARSKHKAGPPSNWKTLFQNQVLSMVKLPLPSALFSIEQATTNEWQGITPKHPPANYNSPAVRPGTNP